MQPNKTIYEKSQYRCFIVKTFAYSFCLKLNGNFKLINIANRFLGSNSYFRATNYQRNFNKENIQI